MSADVIDLVAKIADLRTEMDRKREAGAEAIGVLIVLLRGGDLPKWCRPIAQEVIDKFNGLQQKESQCSPAESI